MAVGERCPFCAIAAGSAPASVVYEDDTVLAFLDIQPINPGHVLVVPRIHVPSLAGLDEATAARLVEVALHVQAAVRVSGVRCEGINLFVSDGAAAGQDVFHVHVHVVPRFAGDGLRITRDSRDPPSRTELDAVAASVRAGLA